ncbi:Uncharacterised protein [Mycobacterium tuberculosis]|nr:Uncharacterised protein [Mycobacterium tuberculosis]
MLVEGVSEALALVAMDIGAQSPGVWEAAVDHSRPSPFGRGRV